jgi:ribonuclease HI
MAKKKFYVVWQGVKPGIYTSWEECKAQVSGFKNARYKSFASRQEAEQAFTENQGLRAAFALRNVGEDELAFSENQEENAAFTLHNVGEEGQACAENRRKNLNPKKGNRVAVPTSTQKIIRESLAVDAACSGNPGLMEYRGVQVADNREVFHVGPFEEGTNNIGEFLAIVHALALLKKRNQNIPVYSDSVNAIKWIAKKKCNTKLAKSARNRDLFELIARAEAWLQNNSYQNQILKWETKLWGEIPADFGRK